MGFRELAVSSVSIIRGGLLKEKSCKTEEDYYGKLMAPLIRRGCRCDLLKRDSGKPETNEQERDC